MKIGLASYFARHPATIDRKFVDVARSLSDNKRNPLHGISDRAIVGTFASSGLEIFLALVEDVAGHGKRRKPATGC